MEAIKGKDYQGVKIYVDDVPYSVPKNWTDDEVGSYAATIKKAHAQAKADAQAQAPVAPTQAPVAPTQAPKPTGGVIDTALDLGKQGFGEFSGMIGGIGGAAKALVTPGASVAQGFTRASEEAKGSMKDLMGTKGLSTGSTIADAGVKALADPTIGLFGMPKAAAVTAKAAFPIFRSLFGAGAGGAGAEFGRDTAEQLGLGTAGQLGGAVAGGMGANLGAGAVLGKLVPGLVSSAVQHIGPMVGFRSGGPKAATERYVSGRVQNTMDSRTGGMVSEQPGLGQQLEQRTQEARALGISDPIPAQVASGNANVAAAASEAASRPEFRQAFNERKQAGIDSTRAVAARAFGDRGDAEGVLSSMTAKAEKAAPAVEARLTDLQTKRKVLAEEFMGKNASTQTELGAKLRALDQATEKTARERMSEAYTKVNADADATGVALTSGSPQAAELAAIIKAVRDPAGADMFKSNMKLNRIMAIVDERAAVAPVGAVILNPTELTALKEGVNEATRDAFKGPNASGARYAQEVQRMVRGTPDGAQKGLLDNISPDYGNALRKADNDYRTTVAGPFGSAEATKLSRAQFMSDVVTRVLSKDEIALGYMARNDATGDQAKGLVREALLHDLSNRSKGEVTPKVFEAWKLRNAAAIEQSGMSKDVASFGSAQGAALKAEADLSEQFQRVIKDDILATMEGGKVVTKELAPSKFVDELRRDPRKLAGFLRQYRDSDGPKAIQSIYTDYVLSSSNPVATLTKDMKDNPQLRALMGPQLEKQRILAQNMEDFSKEINVSVNPKATQPADALDTKAGFSTSEAIRTATEGLRSIPNKVMYLARLGSNRRAEREVTVQMGDLLLSNDRMSAVTKAIEAARKAEGEEAKNAAVETVLGLLKGGAKGTLGVVGSAAQQGLTQGPKAMARDQLAPDAEVQ